MDRPRPRTFSTLALATQQLKLRSLNRIQGCNIFLEDKDNENDGLVYYSLHHNKDEPAIYCSEALSLHLQRQKWAEIVCPEILKSNKNCICVKVWLQKNTTKEQKLFLQTIRTENNKPIMQKESALLNSQQSYLTITGSTSPTDKLLFSWAVYFSGLALLRQNVDVIFSKNSLIFQLNGAYFSSPTRFTFAKTQEELTSTYQRHAMSTSVPVTPYLSNSLQVSRSSSPITECQRNATPAIDRVIQLNCYHSDIRSSYDLDTLLRIQETQRLRLQKIRESADIAAEVKHLSVLCVTANELQSRTRRTSSSYSSLGHQFQNHSMGRKLSKLLAEQKHVEPATLLIAQKLQQQLETIRSKHKLLLSEQVTYSKRNESLKLRLSALKTAREQLKKCLENNLVQLEKDNSLLAEHYQQHLELLQQRRIVTRNMERRMSTLCLELQEIYNIGRNSSGFYAVCGIPFPRFSVYVNQSNDNSELISPLALSALLGYVAHVVQMISVILDQPLRNPIIHEGSHSRIQDVIKEAPYGPRDFPLYSRSSIPPKLVKHAIYLLNQNIAQLCFNIKSKYKLNTNAYTTMAGINCGLRGTLDNLISMFSTFSKIEKRSYGETKNLLLRTHLNNHLSIQEHESNGSITKKDTEDLSTDDVDSFGRARSTNEHSRIGDNSELTRYRYNRSMGSYSDSEVDSFKGIVKNTYSSSDSNIAFWRQSHT